MGSPPALRYVAPLVIRRSFSLAVFELYLPTPPPQPPVVAVDGAAAIGTRPWATRRTS
jgi:hypothetical protein